MAKGKKIGSFRILQIQAGWRFCEMRQGMCHGKDLKWSVYAIVLPFNDMSLSTVYRTIADGCAGSGGEGRGKTQNCRI